MVPGTLRKTILGDKSPEAYLTFKNIYIHFKELEKELNYKFSKVNTLRKWIGESLFSTESTKPLI